MTTIASTISTVGMSREQWLEERKKGIGSSDAAAAVGLSPYKTPYGLWLEKTGEVEAPDLSRNAAVLMGTLLEPGVCAYYESATGRKLRQRHVIFRHPEYPFMLANLDREVVGENRIVEAKTAGLTNRFSIDDDEWGEPGTDKVPMPYLIQVQHQLCVRGPQFKNADLVVIFGGRPPAIYHIERDDELIAMLIKGETAFWNSVETRVPPQATSLDDVRRRFPQHVEQPITATSEIEGALLELRAAQENAKAHEANVDALKAQIAAYMGECDTLVDHIGRKLATFRTQTRAAHSVGEATFRTLRLLKA